MAHILGQPGLLDPVDPGTLALLADDDAQVNVQLALVHPASQAGKVLAEGNHLPVIAGPVGPAEGQKVDCFQQVGLALGIFTQKNVHVRVKFQVKGSQVAETALLKPAQVH